MQHQLGRISIVAWQDSRIHSVRRWPALSIGLAALAAVSVLLLALRFLLGAPLPLELLQFAFAVLVASGAFLLMRGVVAVILSLQQR